MGVCACMCVFVHAFVCERGSACVICLEIETMIRDSLCLCVWTIERDMYTGLCVV